MYYLFSYEESRDLFSIPYDIDILEQVFRVRADGEGDEALVSRPLYNRKNRFFDVKALADVVAGIANTPERERDRAEAYGGEGAIQWAQPDVSEWQAWRK